MPKRPIPAAAPRNRLLDRLPGAEYRRLLPLLEPVLMPLGQVLYEAHGPIDYAYFPLDAVVSAVTVAWACGEGGPWLPSASSAVTR